MVMVMKRRRETSKCKIVYLVEDVLGRWAGAWDFDGLAVRSVNSTVTIPSTFTTDKR